jgi:hypothetical protein
MHGSSLAGRAAERVAAALPVEMPLAATLLVVTLLVVSQSGCTMCPSPYDYSGPVPNGSAPQNDFRARSNGILPLGALPAPWPRVVQAVPTAPASPTLAEPLAGAPTVPDDATWLVVAEAEADPESPQVEEASAAERQTLVSADAELTAETQSAEATTNDARRDDTLTVEEVVPELLPANNPPPRSESPARVLRETDGWRPKR